MTPLQYPWLEFALLVPLVGALGASRVRDVEIARRRTLVAVSLTAILLLGAWYELAQLGTLEGAGSLRASWLPEGLLGIDSLVAPLMALVPLLYLLLALATPKTKLTRVPFGWMLVSLALQMALFAAVSPWGIIALLALQTVPVWFELRREGAGTRVFGLHMGLALLCLAVGWGLLTWGGQRPEIVAVAYGLLLVGIVVRSGLAPFHPWVSDLFKHATIGTAMLFVIPLSGALAAFRLFVPTAPDWALQALAVTALVTAFYTAGLATVKRHARRFLCYVLLSNSALALVGLQTVDAIGVTATLCAWLSVAMTLFGQGLTVRAIEARVGQPSLDEYHGLYRHMPRLAVFFLLTGLSAIGFPGTIGFVATELLVEGALRVSPTMAVMVVVTTALNGIALLRVYFRLFTGTDHKTSISIQGRPSEKWAVVALTLLIIGGGLWPQPGVASRYDVARQIVNLRSVPRPSSGKPVPQLAEPVVATSVPPIPRE